MPAPFPIFKRPVVLIDLDDTLAEFEGWQGWRNIGNPRPYAQEFVLEFKKWRWVTVLWTARAEAGLLAEWLRYNGFRHPQYGEGLACDPEGDLTIDYIGNHPFGDFPANPSKPVADLIIDNVAWPFLGEPVPLENVMNDLKARGKLQWNSR